MKSNYFENLFLRGIINQIEQLTLHEKNEDYALNLKENQVFGSTIPMIFGRAKLSGKIIFSTKDTKNSTQDVIKFVLVVAICQGPLQEISEIWIEDQKLELNSWPKKEEIFLGTTDQNPSLTLKGLFADTVPAFRNLAYIVFNNQTIVGQKIPKLQFVVKSETPEKNDQEIENQIENIALFPESGEGIFGINSVKVDLDGISGNANTFESINNHLDDSKTDAQIGLQNLAKTFPKTKNNWLLVKIAWFVKHSSDQIKQVRNPDPFHSSPLQLKIFVADAGIKPATEFATNVDSKPEWGVGSWNRKTAYRIPKKNGQLSNGGTPDDDVLLEFLQDLKNKGYKILFSPILKVLDDEHAWRGHITTNDINKFFTANLDGYNNFIKYYANLKNKNLDIKNLIDGFAIGNALRELTGKKDGNQFPAVEQLVNLATDVKTIFSGKNIKLTYIADWSEYHSIVDDSGQQTYHMDPLWGSNNIDFVGINAYFPLTNAPQDQLGENPNVITESWQSGEGYGYIFKPNGDRIVIDGSNHHLAWKDLQHWYDYPHQNGKQALQKEIWFVECGFASIDGISNRPGFFYENPNSLPPFSQGKIDQKAQKTAILGTLAAWENSHVVTKIFFANWDLRPWSGELYEQDNWYLSDTKRETNQSLNEKFGNINLGNILNDLAKQAEIGNFRSNLDQQIGGFWLDRQTSLANLIDDWNEIFAFNLQENGDKLTANNTTNTLTFHIDNKSLVPNKKNQVFTVLNRQSSALPSEINLIYFDENFNQTVVKATLPENINNQHSTLQKINLTSDAAQEIAENTLQKIWQESEGYEFQIGPVFFNNTDNKIKSSFDLQVGDKIELKIGNNYQMKIISVRINQQNLFKIQAVKATN